MEASRQLVPKQRGRDSKVRKPARPSNPIIDLTFSDEEDVQKDELNKPSLRKKPEQYGRPKSLLRKHSSRSHSTADTGNIPIPVLKDLTNAADPKMIVFRASQPHRPQNPSPSLELPNLQQLLNPSPAPAQLVKVEPEVWGDYMLNNDDDSMEALFAPPQRRPPNDHQPTMLSPSPQMIADSLHQPDIGPIEPLISDSPVVESKDDCIVTLTAIFPGICKDHVSELYQKVGQSSDRLIAHILDKIENGGQYPKTKDKQKTLKRKRNIDEDEEAAKKYGSVDRVVPNTVGGIRPYIRSILQQEFALTPVVFIDATLSQNHYRLFSAYRILEEAQRTYDSIPPPYNMIKTARKMDPLLREAAVNSYLEKPDLDHEKFEVLKELQAARRIKKKADARREVERQKEREEEDNVRKAEAEGTMTECGCCCCDYPLNRMVHCDGDEMHWFCRNCARTTAEVEIGKSKYELRCMSTDKCEAGFAMDQRVQFLDEKTRVALERNEQEANLRLAGIENLESCPFCPFAAEYPPIEVDREFRCQAEDCERVSCRLCKLESHIPKSCEEFAKENGLSIRRQIEEAMSAALIRKCNKCGTPFVKEEGCNKMTCTRNGCMNIQCYICSKSCGYDHFNDPSRGGKSGNCPLFESVEQRHDDEVKRAEKEALDKVLADHPEYTVEDLKVKMSEKVKEDDERRKARDPRAAMIGVARNHVHGRHPPRVPADLGILPGGGNYFGGLNQALHQVQQGIPPPRFVDMRHMQQRPLIPQHGQQAQLKKGQAQAVAFQAQMRARTQLPAAKGGDAAQVGRPPVGADKDSGGSKQVRGGGNVGNANANAFVPRPPQGYDDFDAYIDDVYGADEEDLYNWMDEEEVDMLGFF